MEIRSPRLLLGPSERASPWKIEPPPPRFRTVGARPARRPCCQFTSAPPPEKKTGETRCGNNCLPPRPNDPSRGFPRVLYVGFGGPPGFPPPLVSSPPWPAPVPAQAPWPGRFSDPGPPPLFPRPPSIPASSSKRPHDRPVLAVVFGSFGPVERWPPVPDRRGPPGGRGREQPFGPRAPSQRASRAAPSRLDPESNCRDNPPKREMLCQKSPPRSRGVPDVGPAPRLLCQPMAAQRTPEAGWPGCRTRVRAARPPCLDRDP